MHSPENRGLPRLLRAEKQSALGLLAAGVAHEINNPLTGALSCLRALSNPDLESDRRDAYFEAALEALERIRNIVERLIDFAEGPPPRPTSLKLGNVVENCLTLVMPSLKAKGIRLLQDVSPSVEIWGDRAQLTQALMNVLLNAIAAVGPGGTVQVAAAEETEGVTIEVTDDGPGMPPEVVERICEPFFSTKPEGEGTGLGMAVTEGIVLAHGGKLRVDSELGRGTSIGLFIPYRETQ